MPSTYTTNNGIELIATGEQSGTWGSTTNTNFELLDTALDGQVSVTLGATGSSGSPNTLPVTDGASSNGRNRLVIFGDGGDLGGTAYVQLTPNDAEKIVYVRNNLSGSRSILLFQGTYSASNDYEIPAGKTAVVFFDGAGSGAVAANVFNNAHFDAMNIVGNVVVGGTVAATGNITTSGTVEPAGDTAAGDNAAIGYTAAEGLILTGQGSTNDVTIKNDADADVLEIPTGTTNVTIAGNLGVGGTVTGTGTSVFASLDISGDIDVDGTTNLDAVDIDGAVDFASTTAHAGNATFADNVSAIFGAGSDLTILHNGSNSTITNTTGTLTIQNTDNDEDVDIVSDDGSGGTAVYFRADGSSGQVKLFHNDSGTGTLRLNTSSDGIDITGHADIEGHFTATDGCTITTADNSTQLTLTSTDADATEGPRLDLRRDSASPAAGDLIGTLRYLGDDDGGTTTVFGEIQLEADSIGAGSTDGEMRLMIRNDGNLRNAIEINSTEVAFNQAHDDVDFRVESDTVTHALFVEGSSGNVGIGKTPATTLDVDGTVAATSYTGDGSNLTGIAAGATGGGSDEIFWENGQNVTTNYTITNGKNAMSAGPITIDSGVTVTVGSGETWTVV